MTGAAGGRLVAAVAVAALAGLAALVGPPLAADPAPAAAEAARRAAAAVAAAAEGLAAARGARDRIAALTATVRALEDGLAALRDGVRRLRIREETLRRGLDRRREEIARLLGALAAIERLPEPALLLHPAGPLGTARLGMMLSHVTPALHAEAERLRAELSEIALLRGLQESALATVQAGLAAATEARAELARAVAERRDLPRHAAESPEDLARLAEAAATLDAFADLLADRRLDPAGDEPPFAERRGDVPMPARGTLLRRPGEADAAGIRRPGFVLATLPRALVTAPVTATIRYRGPLLDYGNVMILEVGEGYLLVLAGLGEVYGSAGEVVPAGSPVGLMGGQDASPGEFLAERPEGGAAGLSETLYVEVRRGAAPVDPTPWFAGLAD